MENAAQTASRPTTAATRSEFFAEIDAGIGYLQSTDVASRNRCVDTLLDLYSLCTTTTVRESIASALDEIGRNSSVPSERLIAALRTVAVVADVDGAFDVD